MSKVWIGKFFSFWFDFIGDLIRTLYDKEDQDRLSINRFLLTATFSICCYFWLFRSKADFPDSLYQVMYALIGGIIGKEVSMAYRYKGMPYSKPNCLPSNSGNSDSKESSSGMDPL